MSGRAHFRRAFPLAEIKKEEVTVKLTISESYDRAKHRSVWEIVWWAPWEEIRVDILGGESLAVFCWGWERRGIVEALPIERTDGEDGSLLFRFSLDSGQPQEILLQHGFLLSLGDYAYRFPGVPVLSRLRDPWMKTDYGGWKKSWQASKFLWVGKRDELCPYRRCLLSAGPGGCERKTRREFDLCAEEFRAEEEEKKRRQEEYWGSSEYRLRQRISSLESELIGLANKGRPWGRKYPYGKKRGGR